METVGKYHVIVVKYNGYETDAAFNKSANCKAISGFKWSRRRVSDVVLGARP